MANLEGAPLGQEDKVEAGQETVTEQIMGIGTGDIIDVAGKKVRIRGFTAPEGDPGRALMIDEISPEEIRAYELKEQTILGKIKDMIKANPNATIDAEQARKYWEGLYDKAGNGEKMEMQINEMYAQKYEEMVRAARERMLVLEHQLNSAFNEAEKQVLLAKIIEERDFAIAMEQEAASRRSYNSPK